MPSKLEHRLLILLACKVSPTIVSYSKRMFILTDLADWLCIDREIERIDTLDRAPYMLESTLMLDLAYYLRCNSGLVYTEYKELVKEGLIHEPV